MNQNHKTRRAFALASIAIIAILATPGLVFGAAKTMPALDLTVGTNRYAVNRSFTYNLGPTGMRGWIRTAPRYNSDLDTGESYWLMGEAMARDMVKLLGAK